MQVARRQKIRRRGAEDDGDWECYKLATADKSPEVPLPRRGELTRQKE
jgi:hypothetical protein